MKSVFADTSFFIALAEPDDHFHRVAVALSASHRGPLITTSAVVLELGAYFCDAARRHIFPMILDSLKLKSAEVVHVDDALQEKGIKRFVSRHDKDWSLTDCVSFVLMEERGIIEAATSDHHFEQAGFIALLRQNTQSNNA